MLETFRGEDFEYVYDTDDSSEGNVQSRNRFRYLGNGFSTKELDPGSDSTWYLDNPALTAEVTDGGASPKKLERIKSQL